MFDIYQKVEPVAEGLTQITEHNMKITRFRLFLLKSQNKTFHEEIKMFYLGNYSPLYDIKCHDNSASAINKFYFLYCLSIHVTYFEPFKNCMKEFIFVSDGFKTIYHIVT